MVDPNRIPRRKKGEVLFDDEDEDEDDKTSIILPPPIQDLRANATWLSNAQNQSAAVAYPPIIGQRELAEMLLRNIKDSVAFAMHALRDTAFAEKLWVIILMTGETGSRVAYMDSTKMISELEVGEEYHVALRRVGEAMGLALAGMGKELVFHDKLQEIHQKLSVVWSDILEYV